MRLPNPDYAIIDDQKLAGYCLNPEHTDGQRKAVVFQSALGIGVDEIKMIRSVWIVRDDEGFPRLVTCYVL